MDAASTKDFTVFTQSVLLDVFVSIQQQHLSFLWTNSVGNTQKDKIRVTKVVLSKAMCLVWTDDPEVTHSDILKFQGHHHSYDENSFKSRSLEA